MGTHIIDSLIVLFSLDTKDFKDGEREVIDGTKRLRENSKSAFSDIEDSAKKLREGIGGVSREVVGLGLAFLGAKSMVGFAANMASGTATADRFSKTLGMNIQQVWAWRQAMKVVNGTAADADASLQAIQNAKMAYKLDGKVPERNAFARFGISGGDWDSSNAGDILKKIVKANDRMDPQVFAKLAQQIGLSNSTVGLVQEKGATQVIALIDQFKGNAAQLEATAKKTEDLQSTMAELNHNITEGLTSTLLDLLPVLQDATSLLRDLTGKPDPKDPYWKRMAKDVVSGDHNAWDYAGEAIGGSVGRWIEQNMGRGHGNTRADRNNNPGNIKDGPFAKRQAGYVGSDGTFAKFATTDAGFAAQESLLRSRSYLGGGRDTIASIVSKWAPSTENNVEGYIRDVERKMGVSRFSHLTPSDLPKLVRAMAAHEGFSFNAEKPKPAPLPHPTRPASTLLTPLLGAQGNWTAIWNATSKLHAKSASSTVTIGAINVTTPAHNGHQIARDVHAGLKRRMQVAQADPVVRS